MLSSKSEVVPHLSLTRSVFISTAIRRSALLFSLSDWVQYFKWYSRTPCIDEKLGWRFRQRPRISRSWCGTEVSEQGQRSSNGDPCQPLPSGRCRMFYIWMFTFRSNNAEMLLSHALFHVILLSTTFSLSAFKLTITSCRKRACLH